MTTSDPQQILDRIKARAAEATPGPWETGQEWATVAHGPDSVFHGFFDGRCPICEERTMGEAEVAIEVEDLEFIAHARTDVDRLTEALEEVLEECCQMDDFADALNSESSHEAVVAEAVRNDTARIRAAVEAKLNEEED